MVFEETLEKFNHELKAHPDYAQILLKITSSSETYEKARQLIEDQGINVLEANYLSSGKVLIKLDVKDMRSITLKLIENGFIGIKGINALSHKNQQEPGDRAGGGSED
ncbi:MAG: hypothetical protein WCO26_06480 [Deltaproteobacteria bacterium]